MTDKKFEGEGRHDPRFLANLSNSDASHLPSAPHQQKPEAKPPVPEGRFSPAVWHFLRTNFAPWLPWILITFGAVFRIRQYIFDRSLWLDEAFVALDVTHTAFRDIWKPLHHGQVTPVGFIVIEKWLIGILGNSEYAFRLFPLLAGVAALFLFYIVAKSTVRPSAVPVALGLFAISGPLIYYSSEIKPYSSDVMVALALLAIMMPMDDLNWSKTRLLRIGIAGAVAIWFSYTAVFILGGIGLTLAVVGISRKGWSALWSLLLPAFLWISSFGIYYEIVLRHWVYNADLVDYWRNAFMPFPPLSLKDISWYTSTLFTVFAYPGGIAATGLAVALFSIGCGSLFLRRRAKLFFLTIPIALTLAASTIHKYPFAERVILFLAPALILLVAEGAGYLRSRCSSSMIPVAVLAALFFTPAFSAFYHLLKPETTEEIRPAINYIRAHDKTGDLLYLYYPCAYAFQYYNERNKLAGITVVRGQRFTGDWNKDEADLSRLRGHQRVWVLFSHVSTTGGVNQEAFFLYLLNRMGKQSAAFQAPGASVYLYDLK